MGLEVCLQTRLLLLLSLMEDRLWEKIGGHTFEMFSLAKVEWVGVGGCISVSIYMHMHTFTQVSAYLHSNSDACTHTLLCFNVTYNHQLYHHSCVVMVVSCRLCCHQYTEMVVSHRLCHHHCTEMVVSHQLCHHQCTEMVVSH